MSRKRSAPSPEYVVSNEAAAYIADALMEIALQFEETHFAQIRRHYQSINRPRPEVGLARFETRLAAWVGRIRTRECHFE
jgi:hypothetical protein